MYILYKNNVFYFIDDDNSCKFDPYMLLFLDNDLLLSANQTDVECSKEFWIGLKTNIHQ